MGGLMGGPEGGPEEKHGADHRGKGLKPLKTLKNP
jgi:hypothetical protein